MEVNNKETSKLCRICFDDGIHDLYTYKLLVDNENKTLKDIVETFSSVDIIDFNEAPSMLCISCMKQLIKSYLFLQRIKKADDQIVELFSNNLDKQCEDEIIFEDVQELSQCDEQSLGSNELEEIFVEEFIDDELNEENSISGKSKNIKGNVSKMLKRTQEYDQESNQIYYYSEPPSKITKDFDEKSSFVLTKLVLKDAVAGSSNLHEESDDDDKSNKIQKNVKMFEIEAVEMNVGDEIDVDLDESTNVENPNTMYMCKFCPRAFSTSNHLLLHARKSHVCKFCSLTFNKIVDRNKHTREYHNNFQCSLCKKDFSSNSNLRQHLKRVHSLKLPSHISVLSIQMKDEEID